VSGSGGVVRIDLSRFGSDVRGIAVDRRGRPWVTVRRPPLLLCVSHDGRTVSSVATSEDPQHVAIDAQERVWITSPEQDQVTVHRNNGEILQVIPLPADTAPSGISVGGDGSVWIASHPTGTLRGEVLRISSVDFEVTAFPLGIPSAAFGDMTGFVPGNLFQRDCDFDGDGFTNGEELGYGSDMFADDVTPATVDDEFVAPVGDLSCTVDALKGVTLSWRLRQDYVRITVTRDGIPIAELPGDQQLFRESGLRGGGYVYELTAHSARRESDPVSCLASVGSVSSADLRVRVGNPTDLAVGPPPPTKDDSYTPSQVYVLDAYSGIIEVVDAGGTPSGTIPSPFGELVSTTGMAVGRWEDAPQALYLLGEHLETSETRFAVVASTGTVLQPPVPLAGLDGGSSVFAADYCSAVDPQDPDIFLTAVDPQDPDIFLFRREESGTPTLDLDLSKVDLGNLLGLVTTVGACFDPTFGSVIPPDPPDRNSYEIYVIFLGTDAGGEWRLVQAKITEDEALRLREIDVPVRGHEYAGIDTDGTFIFLTESLDGYIERVVFLGAPFVRGDANGDGSTNLADAVYILQRLFAAGPAIACLDAGDANDDESVNLADAIYLLQGLFANGPPIPPPHPVCGEDPPGTPDPTKPELQGCIYDQDLCP
jgi:hypothetical protein